MYFKLEALISGFWNQNPFSLVFFLDEPSILHLSIVSPPVFKNNLPSAFDNSQCLIICKLKPNKLNEEILKFISYGKVHPSFKLDDPTDKGEINYTPLMSELPESFKSFEKQVYNKIYENIMRVVNAFRWRFNLQGTINALKEVRFEFSFDRINWYEMPELEDNIDLGLFYSIKNSYNFKDEMYDIIKKTKREPLGHELHREALYQLFSNNPRSALIMGIASAEAGFKQFVTQLQPETEWIMDNIPSPPLVQMLTEYLPNLPLLCMNKCDKPIPQEIISEIKDGVSIRNKMVHGKISDVKIEKVNKILFIIKDLLYLLDYYSGNEWALNFISIEIRNQLKSNKK
jgi:hypothetical protein